MAAFDRDLIFRHIDKEPLPGQVPIPIGEQIREKAYRERRSLSEVTTEILCRGLKVDPQTFGIDPGKRKRRPEPVSA